MTTSSPTKRPRAAVYTRISRDSKSLHEGVDRQLKDCRALAKRLGYEVVEVFEDNDISASTKSRRVRPGYSEMLDLARRGHFDAILAYSNSRLTRRVREYLDLIDLVNKHGVLIKTVVSGDHDLSTADGRATALTIATWDQAEAERTAERTRRAKQEMRLKGEYRGGRRPFGYKKGGMVIKESEAAVIREATQQVLAGRSLSAISRELNERGVKTSRNGPWAPAQLRDVLTRPRNAGYISRGQVGRKGFEIVKGVDALWPPVIDRDTYHALMNVLTDPSRRTNSGNGDPVWLGSGIYRCGVELKDENGEPLLDKSGEPRRCGGVLRVTATGQTEARRNHKRRYQYRCSSSAHLMILQSATDEYVLEEVAKVLRDPRNLARLNPRSPDMSPDRERRAVLVERIASLEHDWAEGKATGDQLQRATLRINAEIEEIDARLASNAQRSAASPIAGAPDPGAAFLAAPVDIQRAVLATVAQVEIMRARERGVRWTKDRVRISPATPA